MANLLTVVVVWFVSSFVGAGIYGLYRWSLRRWGNDLTPYAPQEPERPFDEAVEAEIERIKQRANDMVYGPHTGEPIDPNADRYNATIFTYEEYPTNESDDT